MYARPKAMASYGRVANAETDPIRQIVMLYDGAIKFLNLTAADIDAQDFVAKAEHSTRAIDIINYLQSILDFEKGADVAVNLDKFYRSISKMVLQASAKADAELMRRASALLVPVRDAWQTNAGQPAFARATPAVEPEARVAMIG